MRMKYLIEREKEKILEWLKYNPNYSEDYGKYMHIRKIGIIDTIICLSSMLFTIFGGLIPNFIYPLLFVSLAIFLCSFIAAFVLGKKQFAILSTLFPVYVKEFSVSLEIEELYEKILENDNLYRNCNKFLRNIYFVIIVGTIISIIGFIISLTFPYIIPITAGITFSASFFIIFDIYLLLGLLYFSGWAVMNTVECAFPNISRECKRVTLFSLSEILLIDTEFISKKLRELMHEKILKCIYDSHDNSITFLENEGLKDLISLRQKIKKYYIRSSLEFLPLIIYGCIIVGFIFNHGLQLNNISTFIGAIIIFLIILPLYLFDEMHYRRLKLKLPKREEVGNNTIVPNDAVGLSFQTKFEG